MTGKTHLLGGVAVGAFLLSRATPTAEVAVQTMACAAVGGLFPDIDTTTSKMGNALKPASVLIQVIFGHRTLFHAPLLYLALYAASVLQADLFALQHTAFFAGVASHLALDMLNRKGIPLLYPYKKRFCIAAFSLNGIGEWVVRLLLALILLQKTVSFVGRV